jgi:hypothetical protein
MRSYSMEYPRRREEREDVWKMNMRKGERERETNKCNLNKTETTHLGILIYVIK